MVSRSEMSLSPRNMISCPSWKTFTFPAWWIGIENNWCKDIYFWLHMQENNLEANSIAGGLLTVHDDRVYQHHMQCNKFQMKTVRWNQTVRKKNKWQIKNTLQIARWSITRCTTPPFCQQVSKRKENAYEELFVCLTLRTRTRTVQRCRVRNGRGRSRSLRCGTSVGICFGSCSARCFWLVDDNPYCVFKNIIRFDKQQVRWGRTLRQCWCLPSNPRHFK